MLFPRCLFFPLLSVQTFALFYKKEGAVPLFTLEAVAGRFLTQQSCDCLCSLRSPSSSQTLKSQLPFKKKVPTLTSQNLTRNVKF